MPFPMRNHAIEVSRTFSEKLYIYMKQKPFKNDTYKFGLLAYLSLILNTNPKHLH
jgi:hypothetical protein